MHAVLDMHWWVMGWNQFCACWLHGAKMQNKNNRQSPSRALKLKQWACFEGVMSRELSFLPLMYCVVRCGADAGTFRLTAWAEAAQFLSLDKTHVRPRTGGVWLPRVRLSLHAKGVPFYLHSLCARHPLSASLFHPAAHFNWQLTECHLMASFILSYFLPGCSFVHSNCQNYIVSGVPPAYPKIIFTQSFICG